MTASDVKLNMTIQLDTGKLSNVIEISRVMKKGLYNPFTTSHTLAVNGVVAGCDSEWFLENKGIFLLDIFFFLYKYVLIYFIFV